MGGELKSNVPGPAVGFPTLIDICMEEDDQQFDTFPLRPSNSGKCSRALAFDLWQYLGKPGAFPKEKKSPATKRLLSLGSSVEYHNIRNFGLLTKKNPDLRVSYKGQVMILFQLKPANKDDKNPPLIKGTLDYAIENRKQNYTILFDSKSAKDKFSQAYSSKWDETIEKLQAMESTETISIDYDENGRQCVSASFWVEDLEKFLAELDDPYFEDNFTQLNAYCCSEFAKQINTPAGSIYRYNKNDSRHLEVRFKPNEALYEDFRNKCQGIYNLVMNAETLDEIKERSCDFPLGTMKAAFCPCSIYAGEDRDAKVKAWFATFTPKQWPTDVSKLKNKAVQELFRAFEEQSDVAEEVSKTEEQICQLLIKENVNKVKLDNGRVYEVKHYKTGGVMNGPRVALKRTKS